MFEDTIYKKEVIFVQEIGKRIKKLRNDKKESLRDLGKRLNIAHSHLSMIENGKKKPNLELLEAIAKAYGVSMGYLVGEDYTNEEQRFLGDTQQLTVSELMDKYELVVGDRPATKEEIQEAMKYILIKREMDS